MSKVYHVLLSNGARIPITEDQYKTLSASYKTYHYNYDGKKYNLSGVSNSRNYYKRSNGKRYINKNSPYNKNIVKLVNRYSDHMNKKFSGVPGRSYSNHFKRSLKAAKESKEFRNYLHKEYDFY